MLDYRESEVSLKLRVMLFSVGVMLLAGSASADVRVAAQGQDRLTVSCWSGDISIRNSSMVVQGVAETRASVVLDGGVVDAARYGKPALPYQVFKVLLPRGKSIRSISIASRNDTRELALQYPLAFVNVATRGFDMLDPLQAAEWGKLNRPDPEIAALSRWIPESPAEYVERNFRGYTIVEIRVTPFLYLPSENRVLFSRNLVVGLDLMATPEGSAPYACRATGRDSEMVRNSVVNPELLESYVPTPPAGAKDGMSALGAPGVLSGGTNYYAIITAAAYTNHFEPLRAFHSYDAGHHAAIISLEQIYAQYATNVQDFVRLHDYICNVLYSNGCEYVLLGGDTEILPTYYGCADFQYSDFQIPVGRFSFETVADITNAMNKAMTPVSNGVDRVMLIPRADEYGPTVSAYSNYFEPYLHVDSNPSLYQAVPYELFPAMDTHTILWARGHGYYLRPQWSSGWYPPNNNHIRPFGINFGCSGGVVDWNAPNEHPAEAYQRAVNGNAAYVGTVEDVTPTSYDAAFFYSYFVAGSSGPAVGDMMLMASGNSVYYTLFGDPRYEIVSPAFKAKPRLAFPEGGSYSRSYNTIGSTGGVEDVVFRIQSFNNCGWTISNVVCDAALSNHFEFACAASNRTTDVRLRFLDVTNIPAGIGGYTISFDILDTTNGITPGRKSVQLYVTDKNILMDSSFIVDGQRRILPAGEYLLASDLEVPDGITLVLQPGVSLYTESARKVIVKMGGAIEAVGCATNPIQFCATGGYQGVELELSGTELMPLSGDFKYCYFPSGITTTNHPVVRLVNCTFWLSGSHTSPPLFTSDMRGTMRNCNLNAHCGMSRRPIGDLSSLNVQYCLIPPENTQGVLSGVGYGTRILRGNDFVTTMNAPPGMQSACINTGDPASPPDPDGTRADIGAYYRDLSQAWTVPGQYATLPAAVEEASRATNEVVIMVSPGVYQGPLVVSNANAQAIRIIGTDPTNRPLLALTNDPGSLLTLRSSAVLENLVLCRQGPGSGKTVIVDADFTDAGFINCDFSGNTGNESLLQVDVAFPGRGVCLFLSDCAFSGNTGNGSLLDLRDKVTEGTMEPWTWLENCRFTSNSVTGSLISIAPSSGSPFIMARGLILEGNTSANLIRNASSANPGSPSLVLNNGLFWNNAGQVLAENAGNILLDGCTFYGNRSNLVAEGTAVLEIRNSILWSNAISLVTNGSGSIIITYSDSDLVPEVTGEGNLNTNPLFVAEAAGDFHLFRYSPCIDAGSTNAVCSNEPAPNGGRVNMGVFGNTAEGEEWKIYMPAQSSMLTATNLLFVFPVESSQWYRVEYTPSLLGAWNTLTTNQSESGTIELDVSPFSTQGFFRVINYHP